jgi:hypothetical protein
LEGVADGAEEGGVRRPGGGQEGVAPTQSGAQFVEEAAG